MFVTLQKLAHLAARLPEGWEKLVLITTSVPPIKAQVYSPVLKKDVQVTLDNATQDRVDGVEATCTCDADKPCLHMAAVYRYISEIPIDTPLDNQPQTSSPQPASQSQPEPASQSLKPESATQKASATALAMPEQVAAPYTPQTQSSHLTNNIELVLTPEELVKRHKQMTELITVALQKDTDYGLIPGTHKPTLLKPGAERISVAFGAYPKYQIVEEEIDYDRITTVTQTRWTNTNEKPSKETAAKLKAAGQGRWHKTNGSWAWQVPTGTEEVKIPGLYRYLIQCSLISRKTGTEIGYGLASCSSLEPKYSSRPHSSENTILKMAEKRAFVAAVLNTFGLSDRYTQDVEDFN